MPENNRGYFKWKVDHLVFEVREKYDVMMICVSYGRKYHQFPLPTRSIEPEIGAAVSRLIRDIQRWRNREGCIQDILYYLLPEDREFLMTGITPEEWNQIFQEGENNGN